MSFSTARIALVFLILNLGLFAAKIWAGWRFGSLAVLSDAFNSLVDVATSIFIFLAVKIGSQPADADHPFGHSRAEPLAAFTVAVLTFVLAFEVVREAVERIIFGGSPEMSIIPLLVLAGVITTKLIMFFIARRFRESPALSAVAADAKMDVVISCLAVGGVFAINAGFPQLDAYVALAIAAWIAWIGFTIARDNLAKLMGRCPDEATIKKIRNRLDEFKEQKKIISYKNLRAQFVGSEIEIAVEVTAPKNLSLEKVHDLEESIQKKLRTIKNVGEVAVHVEPA
ncbi:MAG: cation diffusion facilitator family transporter [Candidatus Peribacteraceae bacterium]|nr:cation diffusion facilitator family transporter [Candidatus Peribacteraceae bacterium]